MVAVSVKVDAAGRVVIPKELRDALGIPRGGELRLSVVGGELRGTTRLAALNHLREKYAALPPSAGAGPSAVEDVIAWRRAEAARENAGDGD